MALGHFRHLKVASEEGCPRCEIKDFALQSAPAYFALSYTWGNDDERKPSCNGEPFRVKTNLYGALEQLSVNPETRDAWLWIDAICINQQSNTEKNVLVRAIPEVYKSAQKVLVWLGAAADDSDLAMDTIGNLLDELSPHPIDLDAHYAAKARLPPSDDKIWPALYNLYQRPWFLRLWVVQEVILAKDIIVLCCTRIIALPSIERFVSGIFHTFPDIFH